jgi:hypothetical protein
MELYITSILYYTKSLYFTLCRKISYVFEDSILQICNNILILLCNQPKPSAGPEQDNKRKHVLYKFTSILNQLYLQLSFFLIIDVKS